jgi:hypothetical protein
MATGEETQTADETAWAFIAHAADMALWRPGLSLDLPIPERKRT